MKNKNYEEHGVIFSCTAAKIGETVELIYTGLLKNAGATEVKAHIGYNELWESAQTIDMKLTDDAFVASIKLAAEGSLYCAFVDPVGNWDNNSGANYSLTVTKAASKKATASKSKKTAKAEKTPAKTKTASTPKAAAPKKATAKKATQPKKATTKTKKTATKPAE